MNTSLPSRRSLRNVAATCIAPALVAVLTVAAVRLHVAIAELADAAQGVGQ